MERVRFRFPSVKLAWDTPAGEVNVRGAECSDGVRGAVVVRTMFASGDHVRKLEHFIARNGGDFRAVETAPNGRPSAYEVVGPVGMLTELVNHSYVVGWHYPTTARVVGSVGAGEETERHAKQRRLDIAHGKTRHEADRRATLTGKQRADVTKAERAEREAVAPTGPKVTRPELVKAAAETAARLAEPTRTETDPTVREQALAATTILRRSQVDASESPQAQRNLPTVGSLAGRMGPAGSVVPAAPRTMTAAELAADADREREIRFLRAVFGTGRPDGANPTRD